jgi:phosphoserine phosphatase
MREIILINITGKDKPGLTARLTSILAKYEVTVLDLGQAVIHDYLSLGILIEIPQAHQSASTLKDILFAAHEMGINARFSPIDEHRYEDWVAQQGKQRRIITMLGRRLTASQLAKVASVVAENRLNAFRKTTRRHAFN